MATFDPLQQNISFYAADETTKISVPIPAVDAAGFEALGICISYGTQIGACFIMLIMLVVLTPSTKLRRPSNVLQALNLVACAIHLLLLVLYFTSP